MSIRRIFNNHHWAGFASAVQFLTIIPLRSGGVFDAGNSLAHYPLCGLLIGAVVLAVHLVSGYFWPPPVVGLLDVVCLAVITGALHLDGLADTADGLYGRRDPERALAIMKDSRIGAMGTAAMICCLTAKWAGLSQIPADRIFWLLLVPAYARSSVLFGIRALPYGRPDGGTGQAFFQNPIGFRDFWAVGLLLLLSLLSGWGVIVLNAGFAGITLVILWWYRRKIQCITGDMLGAMIEVTETALFLLCAAGASL